MRVGRSQARAAGSMAGAGGREPGSTGRPGLRGCACGCLKPGLMAPLPSWMMRPAGFRRLVAILDTGCAWRGLACRLRRGGLAGTGCCRMSAGLAGSRAGCRTRRRVASTGGSSRPAVPREMCSVVQRARRCCRSYFHDRPFQWAIKVLGFELKHLEQPTAHALLADVAATANSSLPVAPGLAISFQAVPFHFSIRV